MSDAIDTLISTINKKYKRECILRATAATKCAYVRRTPSDIPAIDAVTGGGVPHGRFLHFRGNKSCGKSSAAYKIAGKFQKTCRHCHKPLKYETAFTRDLPTGLVVTEHAGCKKPRPMVVMLIDLEKSYTNTWGESCGIDNDHLLLLRLNTAEEALHIVKDTLCTDLVDLFIIDSVAQMNTEAELSAKIGKEFMGGNAKVVTAALRVWTSKMSSHGMTGTYDPTIILINQMRDSFSMFEAAKSPGGQALGFYSGIELTFRRKGWIVNQTPGGEEIKVGSEIEVRCTKNKTFAPERKAEFTFLFRSSERGPQGYVDYELQVLRLAKYWGLVTGTTWLDIQGKSLHGEAKALAYLVENPDITEDLLSKVYAYEGIEFHKDED